MIVQLKQPEPKYPDLSPNQPYCVLGIEAGDYRILSDHGKPYLYPADLFVLVDGQEPTDWVKEIGSEGEWYAYPTSLNSPGFFEDYFEGKPEAIAEFWHVVNQRLSKVA